MKSGVFGEGKRCIPVKHGGGGIMAWARFAASGPAWFASIDGAMNSELPVCL